MDKITDTIRIENESIIKNVMDLIDKISNIITEKTKQYVETIHELLGEYKKVNKHLSLKSSPKNTNDRFEYINLEEIISEIINNINKSIEKLIHKTQTSEVYLSQSYVDETLSLHKRLVVLYKNLTTSNTANMRKLVENMAHTELEQKKEDSGIREHVLYMQKLLEQYPFAIDLYYEIISGYLSQAPTALYFDILGIIEADKDRLLTLTQSKKIKKNAMETLLLNPYYNVFGLIPNTNSLSIGEISKILFETAAGSFSDFIKLCKSKNYGLIVLNKHINKPITYKTSHLLDIAGSQKYQIQHKLAYGVDKLVLDRFDTISKFNKKENWDFSIKTHVLSFDNYDKEKDQSVIILDSLAPSYYRIMTNYLSTNKKYFVRVSSIRELYKYCGKSNELFPTRINNYNQLCIEKAMPNVYSPIKVDMEKIKEVSTIVDPKYLRNQIYLRLLDEFKAIINAKYKGANSIKDNFTYGKIIHDEAFLNIFSNMIVEEFHTFLYGTYSEYISGQIDIAEIFGSFLGDIYIYQRTFVKEIHDYFKDNLLKFDSDEAASPNYILQHFDKMIQIALNKLITPDSNLYRNVLYKINLLKNSLI